MYGVVFQPGEPPLAGQMVFWSLDGSGLPGLGEPDQLTVAVPAPDGSRDVHERTVPARRVPLAGALPVLVDARRTAPTDGTHSAAAFWGAAARHARHPTGPFGQLVAAMPPQARAAPVPGIRPVTLPAAEPLLRAFVAAAAAAGAGGAGGEPEAEVAEVLPP